MENDGLNLRVRHEIFALVVCTAPSLKRLDKVHKLGKDKRRLYENVIIPLKERFCLSLNVRNQVDEVDEPTHELCPPTS